MLPALRGARQWPVTIFQGVVYSSQISWGNGWSVGRFCCVFLAYRRAKVASITPNPTRNRADCAFLRSWSALSAFKQLGCCGRCARWSYYYLWTCDWFCRKPASRLDSLSFDAVGFYWSLRSPSSFYCFFDCSDSSTSRWTYFTQLGVEPWYFSPFSVAFFPDFWTELHWKKL